MFAFFKRDPEPDMIRLDAHKEILADAEKDTQRERDTAARLLGKSVALRSEVATLSAELATLKAERDGILRDKLAESERAKLAEQRVNSLLDEIAALKPDADKHREKLRRDRAYVTSKRAQKVVLAA
jgi:chromosome segregation ATPase